MMSDIALECGFSSSSAFARAFKNAFGVSAGEWRKRKICHPEVATSRITVLAWSTI